MYERVWLCVSSSSSSSSMVLERSFFVCLHSF